MELNTRLATATSTEPPRAPAPELGISQIDPRPGMVELGPGFLDASLVPATLMARCTAQALQRWPAQATGYGANAGPFGLRGYLSGRPGATAAKSAAMAAWCGPDNVMTTAGTSATLSTLAMRFAREGRTVLTEAPTYNFATMILATRGVRTIPVPGPLDDIDTKELRKAAERAARDDGLPPALYVIPTFHNPTGRVISAARRAEILALAADLGMVVVEDQAYSDLSYSGAVPPALCEITPDPDLVITLYTFAKCLAPGLRLGWLVTGERLVSELAGDPLRLSGGGASHFVATAVDVACRTGSLQERAVWLRPQLKLRHDVLHAGLTASLPPGFRLGPVRGGFFMWLSLPPGISESALLREAEARGVSFLCGSAFSAASPGIRLCFAAQPPAALEAGASRLADACLALS
ncbi:MAG TPA: PLP-dependent aminotransferase family protein [Streptosporangiaceae bacterium]|nr:PLP-dependent aminotransferase family protein [Streptosporangiaceae bacterium]